MAESRPDQALDWAAHVQSGLRVQNIERSYQVEVPARTLSSVLDELGVSREIDLLSLDVEGAELEALRGLDLSAMRRVSSASRCAGGRPPTGCWEGMRWLGS